VCWLLLDLSRSRNSRRDKATRPWKPPSAVMARLRCCTTAPRVAVEARDEGCLEEWVISESSRDWFLRRGGEQRKGPARRGNAEAPESHGSGSASPIPSLAADRARRNTLPWPRGFFDLGALRIGAMFHDCLRTKHQYGKP